MLTLSKGQQLSDRFTLLSLQGQGGMGEVWLADDQELNERVALKILNSEFANAAGMVELLRQECRNARRLIHPHIVRVFDFHSDDDVFFISMQYVEGADFRNLKGKDFSECLTMLLPIIEALDYAHSLGLIHRDLKPGNILYDDKNVSYLTDFGIAAALAEDSAPAARSDGSVFYQSPQQISSEPPTPSDDIYSLGAVMYELIGGHPPFYPDTSPERLLGEIPPPLETNVPVPVRLEQLVFRMLAKKPADRPSGMREIRDELAACLNVAEGGTAPPEVVIQPALAKDDVEAITPVSRSADVLSDIRPARGRTKPTIPAGIAWAILVMLVLVAGTVFVYLPKSIAPKQPDIASRTAPSSTSTITALPGGTTTAIPGGLAPYEQAQLDRQREEAERIVTQMLRRQATLERQGVDLWGAQAFAAARAEADRGDELFLDKEYTQATAAYVSGLDQLAALETRARELFQTARNEGWQAFEERDQQTAIERFELALTIDSGDTDARRGLERARKLDQVLKHYRAGQSLEKQADYATARAEFQQALNLDPEFEPARAALAKANVRIAGDRFGQAMSDGFAALDGGNFDAARAAFNRASRVRPGSPEPRDGLAQVEFGERQSRIEKIRKQATIMESEELWREAVGRYEKALELDANLTFAQDGRRRAGDMAQLYEQLDLYITRPERLATESVYQNAVSAFYEASALESKGPKLEARLVQLERQIKNARTPVRVVLLSDDVTAVNLYRVGSLGTFENHELDLYPGTYTVVGTRKGYRDVRQKFTVVAGQPLPPITVRCEDKI